MLGPRSSHSQLLASGSRAWQAVCSASRRRQLPGGWRGAQAAGGGLRFRWSVGAPCPSRLAVRQQQSRRRGRAEFSHFAETPLPLSRPDPRARLRIRAEPRGGEPGATKRRGRPCWVLCGPQGAGWLHQGSPSFSEQRAPEHPPVPLVTFFLQEPQLPQVFQAP